MLRLGRYVFKQAETAEELEQVHRLNYKTFVHEIRQHVDSGHGRLVDKYHDRNIYFLCLVDDQLVGMLSVHDDPPFSVESRLADPSMIWRPGMRPLEVRLLSVEPKERKSTVMFGLVFAMNEFARAKGYTHYVISGVTEQLELYRHIGFEAIGPAVGKPGAMFVPMMCTLERVESQMGRPRLLFGRRLAKEAAASAEPISLLPGPVPLAAEVQAALNEAPMYHRSNEFVQLFEDVRSSLCQLTKARSVAMTVGSGTLANEAVAAALAASPKAESGLILVNGEFGRRILKQAERFGLRPQVLEWAWGQPWDLAQVRETLSNMPAGGWVWGVHQESSTGVVNDLPGLVNAANRYNIRACCDCVSSLGAVPLDLSQVFLATGATGKALSSYAGLSLVFADPDRLDEIDTERVPTYLDIPASFGMTGPRFTVPSPLLKALDVAMRVYSTPEKAKSRFDHYAGLGQYVRGRLREIGLPPLADEAVSSPVITSFYPPGDESSNDFVTRCQTWGYHIGGQSGYLADKRVVQIANMGSISRSDLEQLFERMEHWMSRRRTPQMA